MKEMYNAPKCELFALAADAYLADQTVDFDGMLQGSGGGVSEDPNVDIDVPLIPGL